MKSERERQIPYDITYMWNLKYDTNESVYKTETDSQTQRTALWQSRQREDGRGKKREVGVSRRKPLYIEWINYKTLLQSPENCIQYPVINYSGKKY